MSSDHTERDQPCDKERAALQPFIQGLNIHGQIRQYVPHQWAYESSEDSAISSNNQVCILKWIIAFFDLVMH